MKPASALAATTAGRAEIDQPVAVAHAALEIAIGRADADFAGFDRAAAQADARAAAGGSGNRAGIDERLPIASRLGFRLHFGAGRREIKLDAGGDLLAAHHRGGLGQIFRARVHARHQPRLVDGPASARFPAGYTIVLTSFGPQTCGIDGVEIEFQFDGVGRIRIRRSDSPRSLHHFSTSARV